MFVSIFILEWVKNNVKLFWYLEGNWHYGSGSVQGIGYEGEIDHLRCSEGCPDISFFWEEHCTWDVDGSLEFVLE